MDRRLVLTLPYGERAARGIAASAVSSGWNVDVLTRPRVDVDATRVVRLSAGRRVAQLGNVFRTPRFGILGMHLSKVPFDWRAARRLPKDLGSGVLIAFPGAAERTFRAAARHSKGSLKVLHCVDAAPVAHNAELLRHFSSDECRAELYPDWLVRRIRRECVLADVLLVPSTQVCEQFVAEGVPRRKILIEPYGVDLDLFSPDEELRVSSDVSVETVLPRPVRVLYVGQISLRKGIRALLTACSGRGLEVLLVGRVSDPNCVTLARGEARLIEFLSHRDLVGVYRWADVFVLPTLEDACSLVALEAAACGLPIITTSVNGAREILPLSGLTVVGAGSVAELGDALDETVALSTERRARLALAARASLRSWDEYATSVLSRLFTRD